MLVRAVDLDANQPAAELVECLLAEVADGEGPLEVGYLGSRRVTWQPLEAPLEAYPDAPPVVNCMEYALEMLETGRIPLKQDLIPERVTYHDPCNIARSGRIVEQPRAILRAICPDYVEMTPNRTENYCCGGGGGTVSIDEIRAFRTGPLGKRKAEQIRETGAQIVVSPCANCKKQLRELCQDNDLQQVEVMGLHDLLLRVIDFGSLPQPSEVVERDGVEVETLPG